MNSKAKKLLGLILGAVITTAPQAFADDVVTADLYSEILPTVSVTSQPIKNSVTLNASTGLHEGLSGEFLLQTNNNSNFVMTATIVTKDGEMDGFANDGKVLVFTNIDNLPDTVYVNNAKNNTGISPNVIAYPFTLEVSSPMTLHWQPTNSQNKPRWAIFANTGNSATLTQTISGNPYENTYERGIDAKGQYQATVVVTVMEQ